MGRRLVAAGLGAGAVACGLAAWLRREHLRLEVGYYLPVDGSADDDFTRVSGSAFEPFEIGDPYLWLGACVALAVAALLALLVRRRRGCLTALGAGTVACGVVTAARQDSPLSLDLPEGLEESNREAPIVVEGGLNAFDPFYLGDPYLWLGVTAALAVALVLCALIPPSRE